MTRAIRSSPFAGVGHPNHQIEGQVGDVGEGMGLVDGQRGEDGEDVAIEHLGQVVPILPVERAPGCQGQAGRGERRDQLVTEEAALPFHQFGDPGGDDPQLIAGTQAVG